MKHTTIAQNKQLDTAYLSMEMRAVCPALMNPPRGTDYRLNQAASHHV
jgi:hypothetical protein